MTVAPSPERRRLVALKAINVRYGNTAEAERLDAEIRTARLEAEIEEAVAKFPPLSDEQCQRLARLLKAGAA